MRFGTNKNTFSFVRGRTGFISQRSKSRKLAIHSFPPAASRAMGAPTVGLLPSTAYHAPSSWQPSHMSDPPEAPPLDTREAELAALAAQEKLGHDGKRQRVRARRTIDPFGGLERWKIVRRLLHYFSRPFQLTLIATVSYDKD